MRNIVKKTFEINQKKSLGKHKTMHSHLAPHNISSMFDANLKPNQR
jgi:hypothetical protein